MVRVFTNHLILTGASMFTVNMRTKIYLYFWLLIWYSSSTNSWIWITTQVLLAFFNTCHFRDHQCCVVRSCFICELVTSTKLAFLSLQNSRCKYSPMPSEFQFKEPPFSSEFQFKEPPSEFQKAIRHGVWIFSGIAQLNLLHGTLISKTWTSLSLRKVVCWRHFVEISLIKKSSSE